MNINADYDLSHSCAVRYSAVNTLNSQLRGRFNGALVLNSSKGARWTTSGDLSLSVGQRFTLTARVWLQRSARWIALNSVVAVSRQRYNAALLLSLSRLVRWVLNFNVSVSVKSQYVAANGFEQRFVSRWGQAGSVAGFVRLGWPALVRIRDGQSVFVLPPVYQPVAAVVDPVIVLAEGLVSVVNSAYVRRLSDGLGIECRRLSLSANSSSWGWSAELDVDPAHYEDLLPAASSSVEIEIILNETERFVLTVQSLDKRQAFGNEQLAVSAVSMAVWLGEPFAPVIQRLNTSAMTAQQLSIAALQAAPYAGATGFSVEWLLDDWLVPSNAFSFTGAALKYLGEIAASVGGSLLAGRADKVIRFYPLFKAPSWSVNSLTPDFVLPDDVIQQGSLNFTDYPMLNAVMLSGSAVGGILDNVTRTGTAGNLTAQPLNHALYTAQAATRQKGIHVLSQVGRKWQQQIQLPLVDGVGVVDPGKLVKLQGVNNWIVRDVRVSVDMPRIYQVLTVEWWES